MNRDRRARLRKARELIDQARAIIEEARDEEYDGYDNLPAGLQAAARGEAMREALGNLDATILTLEVVGDDIGGIVG